MNSIIDFVLENRENSIFKIKVDFFYKDCSVEIDCPNTEGVVNERAEIFEYFKELNNNLFKILNDIGEQQNFDSEVSLMFQLNFQHI